MNCLLRARSGDEAVHCFYDILFELSRYVNYDVHNDCKTSDITAYIYIIERAQAFKHEFIDYSMPDNHS